MSLTAQVKSELARAPVGQSETRRAEVASLLRFAGTLQILSGRLVIEAEVDSSEIADRVGLDIPQGRGYEHGKLVEELWEHMVGAELDRPVFVRDFPVETSPLVRAHRSQIGVVEKWDLYVRGFELATGYSELIDPVIQRARFEDQARLAAGGDDA